MKQETGTKYPRKVLLCSNLPQRDRLIDEFLATKIRAITKPCGCACYEVRVIPFLPFARENICRFKPDIVIFPEVRCEYTVNLTKHCMEWDILTIAKRTEGGAARAAWDKMEESERMTVVGSWPYDVDLEVVWSQQFADLVVKYGHIPRGKIFVAGGIPFDVYFEGLKDQLKKDKKVILFASGWGHADRSPEYNIPEAPPGSPIHKDAYDRHNKGRTKWIKMIHRVCDTFKKDWDFHLRVKTGEIPKAYQDALGDKIKLVVPCPARVNLQNTDLLIHAGSTMAIEAHLMNVPSLSYCGLINQVPSYNYPHLVPDFEKPGELIKAIKEIELGKSNINLENLERLKRDFYGEIDGKACERLANKIHDLAKDRPVAVIPDDWPPPPKESYETDGSFRLMENWICEACHHPILAFPGREMIKCPWCGISLAKGLKPKDMVKETVEK